MNKTQNSKENKTLQMVKELAKELKTQRRENKAEFRQLVKDECFFDAIHLESVNTCLDYVIDQLEDVAASSKNK